ncbi:sensor histidine kinase [Tenacibaculum sp. UWU-22]|uniref:sensor histidine kinase n=1 Tax=Tenacibaculum sp. UWU-22 TaxID=3234187 RepID=UPI0034DB2CFD
MNKKLQHKTQRAYLYILIVLFVITAPLFYFFIKKLYVKEIDEALVFSKYQFLNNSISKLSTKDILLWNKFNDNVKIQYPTNHAKDTLFNIFYYNSLEKENEPYRELNTNITINGQPYTLSIKTSLLETDELILGVIFLFILAFFLLFIAILLINKLLSAQLWKPFYQTLEQIKTFEIDKNYVPNFPNSEIEEFNQLNKSIENLIEKNSVIYKNQQEFVENAAHELQTPVAVFKAKIDDLIQRSDITKGQSKVLSSLNDAISRLNRLHKNLLLLSKLDKYTLEESETFSVKECINEALSFFIEQAKEKRIDVKTSFKNDITVKANKGLTQIMINNLLLNSISHNIPEGEISILLFENKFVISNTSKEQKLSSDKLFSRFSKTNPSSKGNGLGLSIVKKIGDLYNWSISYSFSDNKHIFCVAFL